MSTNKETVVTVVLSKQDWLSLCEGKSLCNAHITFKEVDNAQEFKEEVADFVVNKVSLGYRIYRDGRLKNPTPGFEFL